MIWQDGVIAACVIIFAVSLFPTVLSPDEKPHRLTCLLTAIAQSTLAATMASLDLLLATAGNAACAVLWWVLVFQPRRML